MKAGDNRVQKGANPPRRNALGRGLTTLMNKTFSALEDESESKPRRTLEKYSDIFSEVPIEPPSDTIKNDGNKARSDKVVEFPTAEPAEGSLLYLSIDRISPNPGQPRQHFEEKEILELAASIKKSGVLQPIIVRRKKTEPGELGAFEIVAGERRFRAAQRAGLLRVPAILKLLTDKEALELGIVENVQRANLNPIEEARAFERLHTEFGETQESIARTVGKDRASIANLIRLLKLPEKIQKMLSKGDLSSGHGRALLMLDSDQKRLSLAEQILKDNLSVRAAEALASEFVEKSGGGVQRKAKHGRGSKTPALLELEERIRRALGTKVKLSLNKDCRGELRIAIFSRAELDSLLEKLNA